MKTSRYHRSHTEVEKLQALIVSKPWCESTININEETRNMSSVSLTEESLRLGQACCEIEIITSYFIFLRAF